MLFFDGKPLIFHTIDAAIESGCFAKEDIICKFQIHNYTWIYVKQEE